MAKKPASHAAQLGRMLLVMASLALCLPLGVIALATVLGFELNLVWGDEEAARPEVGGEAGADAVVPLMESDNRIPLQPGLDLVARGALAGGYVMPENLHLRRLPEDEQLVVVHVAPDPKGAKPPPALWPWQMAVQAFVSGQPLRPLVDWTEAVQAQRHPERPAQPGRLPLGREPVELLFSAPKGTTHFALRLRAGSPPRWHQMRFWKQTERWWFLPQPMKPQPWPGLEGGF